MIATYNNNNYTINCDWLQFSVLLNEENPELICPEDMRIEICQGNNIFEHRALVFNGRGEKLLTLLWKPFSHVLNPRLMTVQIANQSLYISDGLGVKWAWEFVTKIVDCSFNAIGRLDLCCDYIATPARLEFLRHLNSGHYYAQGKREGSEWWHDAGGDYTKKQLHCLSWGSKKSEIKVKTYNKSREQGVLTGDKNLAEKPWIVQEWEQAGLDIAKVWRIEFSMCGAGQLRYENKPLTLDEVSSPEWCVNVLCSLYHSRFVTRINQGRRRGHKNEDRRVYLIDLPLRGKLLKWSNAEPREYECPPAITLLRSMMRQLDNEAVMSNKPTFEVYAAAILDIINTHRLDGYFLRTWEAHPQDYFDERYKSVGYGMHTLAASPSKLSE